jgi:hypothetical protein
VKEKNSGREPSAPSVDLVPPRLNPHSIGSRENLFATQHTVEFRRGSRVAPGRLEKEKLSEGR